MGRPLKMAGMAVLCSLWLFSCTTLGNRNLEHIASGDLVISTRGHNPQRVLLKLPRGYDEEKKYTLLIALHGNGGNAEGLSPAFNSFRDEQIMVALPHGGYPKSNGGYSWFYETGDKSVWEKKDMLSVSRIVEVISEVASLYPIEKVYVLGFSQEVTLAYMTGLRNPSLVAGVAAIAGILPEVDSKGAIIHAVDIEKAKSVRMFIARGRSDGLVERRHLTSQFEYFVNKGYVVTSCEFHGGHTLTNELLGKLLEWLKT